LQLASVNSQGTKAHAVAEVGNANGTDCIRPWFLPDPGFSTPADYGQVVQLHENASPSGYGQLDMGTGGNGIRDSIEGCGTLGGTNDFYIGGTVLTKPGGTQGPEAQGVQKLFDWDPNASVSGTGANAKVVNSCATSGGCSCPGSPSGGCPNGTYTSPRIAIVPLCSSSQSTCVLGGPSRSSITITNFLSFFISGCNGVANTCHQGGGNLEIDATYIGIAGQNFSAGGSPVAGDSFLHTIYLIR
jgi:hypothetical protein